MGEGFIVQNSDRELTTESEPKVSSEVVLHLFRHDKKGKASEGQADQDVRLTDEGRNHAAQFGDSATNIRQSIAFGSPRERAQETAAFHMAGGQEEIAGDETFEELHAKLDAEFTLGKAHKVGVDRNLDFTAIEGTPVGDGCNDAYARGITLEWMVQESDKLAGEVEDTDNSTYNRSAAQIAKIILKHVQVSGVWDKLVESGRYEDKKLERFLGSHQTVPESFLAKVVELTRGINERDRFVDVLGKNGFGFSEGYDIKIVRVNTGHPSIHISYHRVNEDRTDNDRLRQFDFDEDVPIELIEQIANLGK